MKGNRGSRDAPVSWLLVSAGWGGSSVQIINSLWSAANGGAEEGKRATEAQKCRGVFQTPGRSQQHSQAKEIPQIRNLIAFTYSRVR